MRFDRVIVMTSLCSLRFFCARGMTLPWVGIDSLLFLGVQSSGRESEGVCCVSGCWGTGNARTRLVSKRWHLE